MQFVTLRLADSLPADVMRRLRAEAEATADERWRKTGLTLAVDDVLDRGIGSCALADARIAARVQSALMHFDGERYRLIAWVVMPNHIHVVVQLTQGFLLRTVVHGWKWHTAKAANRLRSASGRFWQPDYFDRMIRDEEHLRATREYVELNPVKAGLCNAPSEWPFGSARARANG